MIAKTLKVAHERNLVRDSAALINTPLQRGVERDSASRNRFNGFSRLSALRILLIWILL
jgi:hypothetical protein